MILETISANPSLVIGGAVVVLVIAFVKRFKSDPVPPGVPSLPQSSIPMLGCLPFFIENWDSLPDSLAKVRVTAVVVADNADK